MVKGKVKYLLILCCLAIFCVAFINYFRVVINNYNDFIEIIENEDDDNDLLKEKREYIIVTKNKSDYNILKKAYLDSSKGKCSLISGVKNSLTASLSDEQVQAFKNDKNILSIEEDYIINASIESEKLFSEDEKNWHIKMTNSEISTDLIKKQNKNEKIKVAIIDSGVDSASGIKVADRINLVPGEDEISAMFEDYSGHGTSVAGIITSLVQYGNSGTDSNIELYSAKVLDSNKCAPVSRIIEGIYWAVDNDVDIINMSFGTCYYSQALKNAISYASKKGIILVASAGNGDNYVEYPAAFDEVIAVGGVDAKGEVSDYSVTGESIDLMAPGEDIVVIGAFGSKRIANGTSIAAPQITAIISLLLQKDKSVPSDFIKQLLCSSARKMEDDGTGAGVVDLEYALVHYEDMKEEYKNNKKIEIAQNNSIIPEYDNINYVEGRWARENHQQLVEVAVAGTTYTLKYWELNYIKYGARDVDIIYPSLYGENDSSSFLHGYGNYVANYRYLTYASKYVEKYGINSLMKDNYTVPGAKVADIKDRIKRFPWNNEDVNTNHKKAMVILGFALHTGADAYAHKAYGLENGQYVNINHNKYDYSRDADNYNYFYGRYDGALIMNHLAIHRYFGTNGYGTYKQFVHTYYSNYRLHKLYTYSKKVAESYNGSISTDKTFLRNVSIGD